MFPLFVWSRREFRKQIVLSLRNIPHKLLTPWQYLNSGIHSSKFLRKRGKEVAIASTTTSLLFGSVAPLHRKFTSPVCGFNGSFYCSTPYAPQSWDWLWREASHEGTHSTLLQSRRWFDHALVTETSLWLSTPLPPSSAFTFIHWLLENKLIQCWSIEELSFPISCYSRCVLWLCTVFSPCISPRSRAGGSNREILGWVEIWWGPSTNPSYFRWSDSIVWTIRRSRVNDRWSWIS